MTQQDSDICKVKRWLVAAMAILALPFVYRPDVEQVTRVDIDAALSPDRKASAIVYEETGPEPATGPVYRVYVSAGAENHRLMYPAVEIKGLEGPNLSWDDDIITVSFTKGEVIAFSGRRYSGDYRSDNCSVEIRLNAQCDGMCF